MENKLPTAEELLSNNIDGLKEFINDDDIFYFYKGVICEFAKSLAELHAQEVLKQASEKAMLSLNNDCYGVLPIKRTISFTEREMGYSTTTVVSVDKESILNSYNLDDIK